MPSVVKRRYKHASYATCQLLPVSEVHLERIETSKMLKTKGSRIL